MPAIIKLIIHINLIFVVLLLQQTNGLNKDQVFKEVRVLEHEKAVPMITNDSIIMRWMNAEAALKRSYISLLRSLFSNTFVFSFNSNISHNCSNSLLEYLNGLRNMKTWAFKMFDSSGKIPNGMIGGAPTAFGDFETCLEIESPSRKFQGQYCNIDLALPLPERALMSPIEEPLEVLDSLFDPGTLSDNFAKLGKYLYTTPLRLNACLPSTCSTEDVAALITNIIAFLKHGHSVRVPKCEVKEKKEFKSMEIFIYILFSFLFCLLVLGTTLDILIRKNPNHDIEKRKQSATVKALLCFSAYTNFLSLLKVDNSPDTLRMFHGLRVVSMIWIMWSHSYLVVSYRPFDGAYHNKNIGKQYLFQTVSIGFLAVENFFFMSSVLISYICVRMKGRINMSLFFLKRYIRLTPTMMLVVAFFAIIGRFGSGPMWKETVADSLSRNCLERGWMNLFYLNNYLYSPKICLGWTWYLSTDTQMFLVSLYVCIVMRRKPGRGFLLAGVLVVLSVLLTAFSHVYYKLPPTYLFYYLHFDDWYFYAVNGYTQAHFHLSVSACGLVTGYLLATKKGARIPKNINEIGWFLSCMTLFTEMYLNYKWNQGLQYHPDLFVSTVYGATHRLAWALSLSFVTLSCTWGQGGIINSILSWEGFVPFARLTYLVYLVHYGLVYVYTGSIIQSMLFGHRTLIFLFFNNVIISFATAFVLGLFFEAPLMALEKTFLSGKLRKDIKPGNAVNGTIMKSAV